MARGGSPASRRRDESKRARRAAGQVRDVNVYEHVVTVEAGEAMLRTRAALAGVTSDYSMADTRKVVERMVALVERDPNCAGLAAPQVGLPLRIFVLKHNDRRTCSVWMNPSIEVEPGTLSTSEYEGCFSMPDRRVRIERPVAVWLSGTGLDGKLRRAKFTGLAARAAQHEMDHLDGILIDTYGEPESFAGTVAGA